MITQKNKRENKAKRGEEKKPHRFWIDVLIFLALLLVIYFYFMLADLSTAPKFVYSQF